MQRILSSVLLHSPPSTQQRCSSVMDESMHDSWPGVVSWSGLVCLSLDGEFSRERLRFLSSEPVHKSGLEGVESWGRLVCLLFDGRSCHP